MTTRSQSSLMRFVAAAVVLAVMTGLSAAPPAGSQPGRLRVPRYELAPGQEINWQSTFRATAQDQSSGILAERRSTVWVARRNVNGTWHLIVRNEMTTSQTSAGKPAGEPRRQTRILQADMAPNGQMTLDAGNTSSDLSAIFPPLPDSKTIKTGWSGSDPLDSNTRYKALAAGGPEEFVLQSSDEGPIARIYQTARSVTYCFAMDKGLVVSAVTTESQDYGFHSRGTGTTRLAGIETRDPVWMEGLLRQADVYFRAMAAYEDTIETASRKAPDKVASILEAGLAALQAAVAQVELPMFKEPLEEQISNHGLLVERTIEQAQARLQVIDQPAGEFRTTDFAGKTHTLSDYRGKIVVMDFWYRGCGWCMYAMPQIKQLVEDLKSKPVVVLGMNVDRQDEDAKVVMETMRLNYPTLHAEQVAQKYKVKGFPTLLIIDGQGIVRDVHKGYSPTLRENVSRKVNDLLEKSRDAEPGTKG